MSLLVDIDMRANDCAWRLLVAAHHGLRRIRFPRRASFAEREDAAPIGQALELAANVRFRPERRELEPLRRIASHRILELAHGRTHHAVEDLGIARFARHVDPLAEAYRVVAPADLQRGREAPTFATSGTYVAARRRHPLLMFMPTESELDLLISVSQDREPYSRAARQRRHGSSRRVRGQM